MKNDLFSNFYRASFKIYFKKLRILFNNKCFAILSFIKFSNLDHLKNQILFFFRNHFKLLESSKKIQNRSSSNQDTKMSLWLKCFFKLCQENKSKGGTLIKKFNFFFFFKFFSSNFF
jgi:hypothetical protein